MGLKTLWDSELVSFPRVICDIMRIVFGQKLLALVVTFLPGLLCFIILEHFDGTDYLEKIPTKLSDVNTGMIGINIAILGILAALFVGKNLSDSAKKAIKVQYSIMVVNAFLHFIVVIMCALLDVFPIQSYLIVTFLIQCWALCGVIDIFLELFTLHTAIVGRI